MFAKADMATQLKILTTAACVVIEKNDAAFFLDAFSSTLKIHA